MRKTTAPGSSGGLYVDDNPSMGVVGTLLVAADRNIIQDEIASIVEGPGLALDGADSTQSWKGIRKAIKERSREVGELFTLLDRKAPVGWSSANADTYFPGKCLTSIESYEDISETNWPDLVPYLRGIKSIFKDGITGEISSAGVTNWAIATNVATLTFTNNADHIAFLAALLEDETAHGSYTNWRTITLANAIGNITAGTYAITNVNASSRTVSFAFVAADASGAITASAEFYAHRVAGSVDTARLFSASGLNMQGANDVNGYFVSGGLRRRGFTQGHKHYPVSLDGITGRVFNGSGGGTNLPGNFTDGNTLVTSNPITDGVSGSPRVAKETNAPAITAHIYIHGGRYVA